MSNASCRDWFRRRALETAFTHPSCMVYPPCEPPPSVRRPPVSPPPSCRPSSRHDLQKHTDTVDCSEADRYWRHLVRQQHELHSDEFVSESRYQQGPDTFLLQLQDPGLPARLRHYIKVAGERSQQLPRLLPRDLPFDRSLPAVHERRKFVDIVRERERQQHQRRQLWRTGDSQDCDIQEQQDNNAVVDAMSRGDSVSCHVHDQQHVATQHLTLPAQAAPFIREKPCDVSFRDGSICCLSVVADGAAPLNIQWFRNDLILAESQRVRISDNGVGRCTVTFDPVKQFDQGHYKVVVSNAIGHTQAMCRLFEGCTPAQPLAPTVCDCSSGEVLLRWPPCLDRDLSHDAGATLSYSLQMKQPAEQDWTQVADDIRHEFFVVSNLRPASQYHFRVRASNSVGWSSFSQSSVVHKTRDADSGHRIQLSTCEKHVQLHGRQQDGNGDNNDAAHCAVESWAASVGGRCLDYSVETDRGDAAALTVPVLTQTVTNDYHFLSVINRGRFSLVAKCRQTASSQLKAAKILDCSTTEAYNAAKYEADMVSSLRHCRLACVLAIHHVHDKYLLVMECLHGLDIVRHLCQRHIYTEDTVAHVISQVLDALEYLHWRRIVHANIQPDNIVSVSCRCVNVKLVDFGCSRQMSPQSPCQHVDTRQHHHNEFAAPELLLMDDGDKSDAAISAASDIWAAVVITYLLLSGCSPFYTGAGDEEVRHNITHVRIKYDRLPAGVTSEAAQFIIAALKMTASDRPSASECLQHRWLSNSDYMIQQRQQLVLHGTQLQEFSERYHGEKTRQALSDNRLGECFGIGDREPVELF